MCIATEALACRNSLMGIQKIHHVFPHLRIMEQKAVRPLSSIHCVSVRPASDGTTIQMFYLFSQTLICVEWWIPLILFKH